MISKAKHVILLCMENGRRIPVLGWDELARITGRGAVVLNRLHLQGRLGMVQTPEGTAVAIVRTAPATPAERRAYRPPFVTDLPPPLPKQNPERLFIFTNRRDKRQTRIVGLKRLARIMQKLESFVEESLPYQNVFIAKDYYDIEEHPGARVTQRDLMEADERAHSVTSRSVAFLEGPITPKATMESLRRAFG